MHTSHLLNRLDGSLRAIESLRAQIDVIAAIANEVHKTLTSGGTLLTCGNGGSAAQALHLSEELIGRYRSDRPPYASVCLNADPTALTCIANDFGFDQVFARPCAALLKPGDALLVLTTSGKSANVVKALEVARAKGNRTIGLLGGSGGTCRELCDLAVIPAGEDSASIQEAHQVLIHLICERMEAT